MVQFLLERGAGLEQGASTPLMEAAQEGHYEVVQYLIDQGGHVRIGRTDSEGHITSLGEGELSLL